jgi:RNA recognition motif-containing protein
MGNKLYVGNLSYNIRDDDLQQAFAQYGTVSSAKVMMDRDTGRSASSRWAPIRRRKPPSTA